MISGRKDFDINNFNNCCEELFGLTLNKDFNDTYNHYTFYKVINLEKFMTFKCYLDYRHDGDMSRIRIFNIDEKFTHETMIFLKIKKILKR